MKGTERNVRSRHDDAGNGRLTPRTNTHEAPIQRFGTVQSLPIALGEDARKTNIELLNQLLADTMSLRDLYKKHHWQVVGHTFYQLHLLFDKHYEEQVELIDTIAERIQMLGGIAIAMAADVAETTRVPRPPRDRESVPVQLSRLLEAHQIVLEHVRKAARTASENGDDGTNDMLAGDVLRTNEMQVWFLSEHLVDLPVVPSAAESHSEEPIAQERSR